MRRGPLGRARQPPRPHLTHYGAPASAALKATAVWGLVFLRSTFSRPPEFSGFERQPKATADQPKRLKGDRAFARRSSVGHSPPPASRLASSVLRHDRGRANCLVHGRTL